MGGKLKYMDPSSKIKDTDSFEDHPRYINYLYNQLEHGLVTEPPKQRMRPEKYFLIGVFFFFAVGIVISIVVLVKNIERSQKTQPVSAREEISPRP